jgi:hypothetical protein
MRAIRKGFVLSRNHARIVRLEQALTGGLPLHLPFAKWKPHQQAMLERPEVLERLSGPDLERLICKLEEIIVAERHEIEAPVRPATAPGVISPEEGKAISDVITEREQVIEPPAVMARLTELEAFVHASARKI